MSSIPDMLRSADVEPRLDDLHRRCLAQCKPGGLYLELGVCEGTSLRMLRDLVPLEQTIYGFDSFEGLPEAWNKNAAGAFKTSTRIRLSNVKLVVGWFDDTVPNFTREHADEYISYMHIDCDLYSSTKTVLLGLSKMIVPGTVIVFDEFFGYGGWQDHEYKAFMEFISETGRDFEVIARHSYFRAGIKIV